MEIAFQRLTQAQPTKAPAVPLGTTNSYQAAPEGSAAAIARREQEHPIVTAMGKGSGEALGDVLGAVNPVNIAKAAWHSFPPVQAYDQIQNVIPVLRAYESARTAGKTIPQALDVANEMSKQRDSVTQMLQQRVDEFRKTPGQATVHALGDVAALASTMFEAPEMESGLPKVAAEEAAPVAEAAVKPPGLVKQIVQGKESVQPAAQSAVRTAAQASTETAGTADESMAANIQNAPILKGNESVLDQPLSALKDKETALYKKLDDAAGFDVKAEKAQLANDQYKLKQLGNTDTDVTQRGNLLESINDSQDRITAAETKLRQAGIDPKAADVVHQSRMAGEEFKKVLVRSTNADGSIDVDKLLAGSKSLRFSKYGDRIGQFAGPQNADRLINTLAEAQRNGIKAVTTQKLAKIIGTGLGIPAVGAVGYGVKKLLE